MELLWQLFPFYLAFCLLVLLVPVRINLLFLRENRDDHLVIKVKTFFPPARFQVEVPLLKQETPLDLNLEVEVRAGEDEPVWEKKKRVSAFDLDLEKLHWILSVYCNNRRLLLFAWRFISRAVTVEKFHLRFSSGTSDAALTGLLFGVGWTVAGSVDALLRKRLRFREPPQIDLRPDFSLAPLLKARLEAAISCRAGHFLLAGLLMLVATVRGGEKRLWKTILSRG